MDWDDQLRCQACALLVSYHHHPQPQVTSNQAHPSPMFVIDQGYVGAKLGESGALGSGRP